MAATMPSERKERCVADDAEAVGLDVCSVQPYERNPRHSRNPEYDRIKDSIRENGLDQPLVVTQRPGATDYIVQAGGNTRLLILKELFEETKDVRFARAPCLFRPWICESDVLLAHLRENDLRGNLTFIDKARAVCEARQLLGEELGLKKVSQRRLEAALRDRGFRVSDSGICLMMYAVETLLPLIPEALNAGMGGRHVKRIRVLERVAGVLWQQCCTGGESVFDDVFAALCQRYDGPDWDTDMLQGAIETEIAEESETSIHTIRVALDAEINGRTLDIPAFVPIKEPTAPERHHHDDGNAAAVEASDDRDADNAGQPVVSEPSLHSDDTPKQPSEDLDAKVNDVTETLREASISKPDDLKSLRGRAWTLAARLAQRNGIGDLIIPLSGVGLGFALCDVPDQALADQLDEEALAQICMLWWQLAACSEMTCAPLEAIIPLLPAESVLRRALKEEDAALLFNSIWTLDPGHTGYRLWQIVHDRDWRDLLNLMDTYRCIRHLAAETGTTLWSPM